MRSYSNIGRLKNWSNLPSIYIYASDSHDRNLLSLILEKAYTCLGANVSSISKIGSGASNYQLGYYLGCGDNMKEAQKASKIGATIIVVGGATPLSIEQMDFENIHFFPSEVFGIDNVSILRREMKSLLGYELPSLLEQWQS